MRQNLPRLISRRSRLVIAITIALALAATHAIAQFASFTSSFSSFEGELWGVRQELATPVGGYPSGVAYVNGTLFVADAGNATVIAYDNAGEPIGLTGADWADTAVEASPAYGLAPNQLFGTTVMKDMVPTPAVLVSDGNSHRVLAFDTAGAHLFTLQLARPGHELAAGFTTGLALAPGSRFVLTTTGAVPVLELEGSFAAGWTNEWESDGVVLTYQGIASVPYNASHGRFEATPGKVLTGQEGNNLAPAPQLPYGVVFDAAGNLYTVDTNTERLNVYDATLEHLFTFGTPAPDGTLEEFIQPYGMAFAGDRLIVADPGNHRLAVYRPDLINGDLDFLFYIEGLGDGWPKSVAVDSVTGRIAASDLDDAAARVWVFETPNLATFSVQVLDDQGAPVESVCLGTDYSVQFSVTVPAGRSAVSDIAPTLSIDNALVTSPYTTGGAYPAEMQPGDVATYTYALSMAANAAVGDFVIEAGATASTTDVLFRQAVLSVADCSSGAPTITSSESHDRQVSGWTPIPPGETLVLTLTATDDEGVGMIEYQISGQNDPWVAIAPVTFAGDQTTESFPIALPEFGPSKVRFRARDNGNNKSAWTELEFRIQNVPDVQSNEGATVSFAVGHPIGTGYTFSATGLPVGATINSGTGLISGFLDFDASGVYQVEVTETLGAATSSVSFEWVVLHINRPPVIEQPANAATVDEDQFTLQIIGYDPDGDQAFFTMYGRSVPLGYDLPPTITIDPATGLITGTFGAESQPEYIITVGLSECSSPADSSACTVTAPGERLATLVDFTVAVSRSNMPPTVISPGTLTNAEGDVINLQVAASDPDDDPITYHALNLPLGLVIDQTTGVVSGTISHDALRSYAVTLEVRDDQGQTSTVAFTWNVTDVNRGPTLSVPDQLSLEGETITGVTVERNDPDGDALTFSMSGLPLGTLTIDANTGVISGTFDYSSAGVYQVTVTANDGMLTGSVEFVWTVLNVNRYPVLNVVDQFNAEGQTVAVPIDGSDPDGDALTFSMNGLPVGFEINPSTGVITGTFSYASAGVYSVNIGLTDGTDALLKTFTWTVTETNRAPIVIAAADQVNTEGDTVTGVAISASDPDGDPLTYSAANLPAGLTIDSGTGVISGTVGLGIDGVFNVTASVTDGDEAATTGFTWTVHANRPPEVLALPDRSDAEGDTVAFDVSATDPDASDVLTYAATGLPDGITIDAAGRISGTLTMTSAGVHSVVVIVSDGMHTINVPFTWTVIDVNQPPTISSPDRISNEGETVAVTISANDPDGSPLTFTMSGLPATHTINSSTGVISGTFDYESAGSYTVTVTVSDGLATASTTFTWLVLNINRYPVLNVVDQFNEEGQTVAVPIDGSDPDGDALTFSMNGLPVGFEINPSTGVITGTFSYDSAGVYSVNVGLTDGTDALLKTFTWTVTETNRAPVVDPLPNRLNAENDTVSVSVVATDPDGHTLSYSATDLPDGLTINPTTGLITGTLSYTSAGTYVVQILVSDGQATTTGTFIWEVTNVNRPPTASAVDRTNAENDTVSFSITSADPDLDPLTYSAAGLPAGITIHPTTGVISGTLGYSSSGDYEVVVTVTDTGGLTASAPFAWTVTNTNAPPTITTPGNQTNFEGETVSVQVVASDIDGEALTYSASGLPPGLTIDSTGLISGLLSYATAGTYPAATVTVSDGVTSRSVTFAWTVTDVNRPPAVTNPGTQNSAEGTTVTLPISASDPDGQPLTYSATGLPPGLSINSSSGVISGTLTYAAAGLYTVTVRASDGSLFDEETFTWNVTNTNQAPTASPDSASVVQGQSVVISVLANDTDPDGNGTLSIQSVSTPAQGSVLINSNGTLTYTADPTYTGPVSFSYTITDGALTSTAQVTITVQPSNRPPVCSATASAGDLWPPNHKPRYLSLTGITDPDGDLITIRYTGILQDEPVDSVGQGNTPDFDGGIEDNGASAWIRAERTGNRNVPGDGRVYLISYTATDPAGASCSGTTNLGVPHDQRGTPAVLSPGRWNSLDGQLVYAPPPDAVNDVASVKQGKTVTIAVLGNDTLTLQPVVVTIVGAPSVGTATTNGQTITYLAPSTKGSATLTYRVTGPFGTDTATVTIAIK